MKGAIMRHPDALEVTSMLLWTRSKIEVAGLQNCILYLPTGPEQDPRLQRDLRHMD